MVNGVIDADSKGGAASGYADQNSDYLAFARANAPPLRLSLGQRASKLTVTVAAMSKAQTATLAIMLRWSAFISNLVF